MLLCFPAAEPDLRLIPGILTQPGGGGCGCGGGGGRQTFSCLQETRERKVGTAQVNTASAPRSAAHVRGDCHSPLLATGNFSGGG